jgi:hypothetical protein
MQVTIFIIAKNKKRLRGFPVLSYHLVLPHMMSGASGFNQCFTNWLGWALGLKVGIPGLRNV